VGEIVRHDYTIGTLDVLKACDACEDVGHCSDCVVFPILYQLLKLYKRPNLRNTFDGHPLRGCATNIGLLNYLTSIIEARKYLD